MDISNLSKEERAELLHALKKQEKEDSINRREAYETLRCLLYTSQTPASL